MHLPDGFLSLPTATVCAGVSTLSIAVAFRKANSAGSDRIVPLLGVSAAGLFAAQMVNFPIPGGTSGHLMGGVLASILLGAWLGLLAIACVLFIQCLLFADGGVLALGANILNMGVIGCLFGHLVWRTACSFFPGRSTLFAAAFAAWLSTVAASAACGVQLAASGVYPFASVLAYMVGLHAVIGLGEALITVMILRSIMERRPELVQIPAPQSAVSATARVLVGVIIVSLTLAPLASSFPDGLEKVAEGLGFASRAVTWMSAPFADYTLASISGGWTTIFVGAIGAAATLALGVILSKFIRGRSSNVG